MNQAKGNFDGPRQSYTIGANDQMHHQRRVHADHHRLPQRRAGAAVRRRQRRRRRGKLRAGGLDEHDAGRDPQHPAPARRQHHRRGRPHQKLLPQLKASLPPSIKVHVLTDRTTTIRASVKDVEFELMLTVALVVMVIFLFLRNLSATIIPSVAVPLSLVGTFGVMYLLGYSLNNLTLMALTISTGFVVDDAIVMIENISRYIEEGEQPLRGRAQRRPSRSASPSSR